MSNSFRKIDYRLRPAKSVERRMMAEAFLRLRPFAAVETYRYVGMGSVYFADFAIFHAICGFQSMVSIEDVEDRHVQERFRFNAPLGHIELNFNHSSTALPALPWDLRSIVWMDYDGHLSKGVLTDLKYLATKLSSGSVLLVTVNADLADEEEGKEPRIEVLKGRLEDEGKLPARVISGDALNSREIPRVFREILTQELRDGVNDRNAGRPEGQKYSFEQILFFTYEDGAPMLTLGWVFFDDGQRPTFTHCDFGRLKYFRSGDEPMHIQVPLITNAEVRALNRVGDGLQGQKIEDIPVPPSEVAKYDQVRRYWPMFAPPELT
jgi:hypothetical protein